MVVDLRSKFIGCMIGSALGDAIGEIAFSYPNRDELLKVLGRVKEFIYTDDTAMAIGLAESLVEKKGIDQNHLGETFQKNFNREPWRGYASGPPSIFTLVRRTGIPYVMAAKSLFGGEGSLGNGAAMRIAPLGLYYYRSDLLYEKACASAEVTHAHPIGKDGAAVQAYGIAQAVGLDPEEEFPRERFIKNLISFAKTLPIRKKMEQIQILLDEGCSERIASERLGRSVAVDESMPFAIYSFLRYPKSFEACLLCSILNGGDRDTLGAMAGSLSGAYLGIEAIPQAWREKLENLENIERLASSIFEMTQET
ncbi:MAG: ADP-ribosylglycohydrolase family protein [Thermodesulfobacteriota bacterium]